MKFNYVRIVALFILLVSVGVFTSCSSFNGDDENDTTGSAYAGDWKLVKATFTGETAEAADFAGFSIALNSAGTYVLTNPTAFPSPTEIAGTYTSTGQFLIFDGSVEINVTSISGNTMVWEWQVSKPGKITATYRYTFERM
ncbi:hypothetical protein Fleli_2124 [Bernardetia litoralis DSM 6794]|uniref:Lipocalin-like domain-containing protein n=1 Tax=Bernardetia litoralis (strain ATCC 23117 / DSM 6794 / NBRC 15988 / NCIMB 1366 / Fx l1 / Sio-4) TaxID=880071 RepID=I4AKM1_BERLS|nr:hypothetical protein [Bernardetia litoralis]AFM04506.1 hypothetical protein Fleli_2124 [Bernardetia litoralis DSM 6794]